MNKFVRKGKLKINKRSSSVGRMVFYHRHKGLFLGPQRSSYINPKVVFYQPKGLLLWPERSSSVNTMVFFHGSKGLLLLTRRSSSVGQRYSFMGLGSSSMGPKDNCNPCKFFLWCYLQERVYHPFPTNLAALKRKIKSEFERIPEVMVIKSILDMKRRGGSYGRIGWGRV